MGRSIEELEKHHEGFKRVITKPYSKGLMVFCYDPYKSLTFTHGDAIDSVELEIEETDVEQLELWSCEVWGDHSGRNVFYNNRVLIKVPRSSKKGVTK